MLQVIRSKATSVVIKILFGLLIVSFAIWGIGDIFRNRGANMSVATVGGRTVTVEQLNERVRADMDRLRQAMGGNLDMDQAKQLGVVDRALQTIISGDLLDQEADRLKLGVSDDTVRRTILENPNFHNDQGQFDRGIYTRVLAAARMSEPQFETLLRRDIARFHLSTALTDGLTPPPALVDALYRAQAERRVADTIVLPPSAAGTINPPNDDELKAYYEEHQDQFRAPERRSFSVASLRLDDVAAAMNVPEDQLKSEYEARAEEYHAPEQRQVKQLLLPDKAKAEEAEKALAEGKDFPAVAKEVADAAPDTLDLGWVKRDDLPPAVADAAFALKEGEVSQPVETPFGWHVLEVTGIKPESTMPFEQVKDKVRQEVARDKAGDEIAKAANRIEDALAGGASFADVAQRFALKTITVDGVDNTGHDAAGNAPELPQPSANVLRTAFDTAAGQTSQLNELGEDGYYIVQVDKVTPSAVKPLDEVKEQATQLWIGERRNERLQKIVEEITAEVNGGKDIKDVAPSHGVGVKTTPPLQRTSNVPFVPAALVAKLFEAQPGQAVATTGTDSYAVAQLREILPADPAKDKDAVDRLSREVAGVMGNDTLEEYEQALRRRFPVEIDQAKLDQLL